MEDTNLKYNQLLDKLRHTHPVLDNPDELTGNILWKIEQLQNAGEKNRTGSLNAWLSGIAAACFTGLMIGEMKQPSVSAAFTENHPESAFVRYIPPARTAENPEQDVKIPKQQYYRAWKEKQKTKSAKHRLYTNYMSYLKNE